MLSGMIAPAIVYWIIYYYPDLSARENLKLCSSAVFSGVLIFVCRKGERIDNVRRTSLTKWTTREHPMRSAGRKTDWRKEFLWLVNFLCEWPRSDRFWPVHCESDSFWPVKWDCVVNCNLDDSLKYNIFNCVF